MIPSTPKMEAAIAEAQRLGVDGLVHRLVSSGFASDGVFTNQSSGCSYSLAVNDNAASVTHSHFGLVYEATDNGQNVTVFRAGPWVDFLAAKAGEMDASAAIDEAMKAAVLTQEQEERFSPVPAREPREKHPFNPKSPYIRIRDRGFGIKRRLKRIADVRGTDPTDVARESLILGCTSEERRLGLPPIAPEQPEPAEPVVK